MQLLTPHACALLLCRSASVPTCHTSPLSTFCWLCSASQTHLASVCWTGMLSVALQMLHCIAGHANSLLGFGTGLLLQGAQHASCKSFWHVWRRYFATPTSGMRYIGGCSCMLYVSSPCQLVSCILAFPAACVWTVMCCGMRPRRSSKGMRRQHQRRRRR